ncbi:hypothetical protein ACYOEI_09140 [Singulisphaera rosea]
MDQAKYYLVYWVMFPGLFVCFAIVTWKMLTNRHWKSALLGIAFLWACGGGLFIPLIVGWQEADKWKIKKVMMLYSGLIVVCGAIFVYTTFDRMINPEVVLDAKTKARMKAQAKADANRKGRLGN